MRKIRLIIEYDGTNYHGWQIQNDVITVQGKIEEIVSKLNGFPTRVYGASRTDAGVHALSQVAAFDTATMYDTETIKRAINATLPIDIRVLCADEVNNSFNPRDDAVSKKYFYLIVNERKPSVFIQRYTAHIKKNLDIDSMLEASECLIGEHDFSAFMGTGTSIKNTIRKIFMLNIESLQEIDFLSVKLRGNFIKINIEANGFLRHMVRNIAGTLIEVGSGRIPASEVKKILKSRNRNLAGPTAPAQGLFLEKISY